MWQWILGYLFIGLLYAAWMYGRALRVDPDFFKKTKIRGAPTGSFICITVAWPLWMAFRFGKVGKL